MAVFLRRPAGYQVGLVALFVFTGLFIVGFGAPYWIKNAYGSHMGLWLVCGSEKCNGLGVTGIASWFHFVRAAEVVGLGMLLLSCLLGLSANCRSQPKPFSRSVESWALVGGISGLGGTVVYYIMIDGPFTFTWAVYLASVGSAGAFLCFFVISCNNRPPADAAPQATMATAAGGEMHALGIVGGTATAAGQPGSVGVQGVPGGVTLPTSPYPPSYGPSAHPVYHVPTAPPHDAYSTPETYSSPYPTYSTTYPQ